MSAAVRPFQITMSQEIRVLDKHSVRKTYQKWMNTSSGSFDYVQLVEI